MQLLKLIMNHSTGRTRSWRICIGFIGLWCLRFTPNAAASVLGLLEDFVPLPEQQWQSCFIAYAGFHFFSTHVWRHGRSVVAVPRGCVPSAESSIVISSCPEFFLTRFPLYKAAYQVLFLRERWEERFHVDGKCAPGIWYLF